MKRLIFAAAMLAVAMPGGLGSPAAQSLGAGLYAYISDNDASCNSVFLIGKKAILVVDTGLNDMEGEKILAAIRSISPLPVRYIVNTHYHPDHQAANGIVGPTSEVVTTLFTRQRTIELMNRRAPSVHFRPATITVTREADIYLDDQQVHLEFAGPAHTMGDLVVYFPSQGVVATGVSENLFVEFLLFRSPAVQESHML